MDIRHVFPGFQRTQNSAVDKDTQIVVPDYFNGDPVDPTVMESGVRAFLSRFRYNWCLDSAIKEPFDFTSWKSRHGKEQTRPPLDKVINALKDSGVTKFAAVGFCFGGTWIYILPMTAPAPGANPSIPSARYVFDLAFDDMLKVSIVTHPSLLVVPDDLEVMTCPSKDFWVLSNDFCQKYRDTVKAPLLINSCEVDHAFNQDAQVAADKILKDFGPGYSREYFEGVSHGFTVRGDLNDPKVKEGRERAFKVTVEWLKKYL